MNEKKRKNEVDGMEKTGLATGALARGHPTPGLAVVECELLFR
ncbi:MAG: hypothetical protein ACYTGZ_13975 [Planctomycetota bacterium]|jgi:hypothetical protein